MQTYEITGTYCKNGKPITVKWRDDKIAEICETSIKELDYNPIWIANPLFDIQVNGFAGIDFQASPDSISEDALLVAVERLNRACCARFFLTLITDRWDAIIKKLTKFKSIREKNPALRKAIVGWHIEGPFLSDKPGFYGAHNSQYMIDPSLDHIRQLREVVHDDPVLLTIAPERNGSLEFIDFATRNGIVVFIGHSDAPSQILKEAIKAGAKGFTHLGNGCPQLLHRKDNILWRVLDLDINDSFKISLIPDSIHLSPPLFRLIHKVLSPNQIIYISDAVSGADAPPGNYRLGELEVTVEKDGAIWNSSKTGYAGSSLRPIDGILRSMKMLNCDWQRIWKNYSDIPASLFNINTDLLPGSDADFIILEAGNNGELKPVKSVVSGKIYTVN